MKILRGEAYKHTVLNQNTHIYIPIYIYIYVYIYIYIYIYICFEGLEETKVQHFFNK